MIHDSAWKNLQEIESGNIGVVGVNSYLEEDMVSINTQGHDNEGVQIKIAALNDYRNNRESDLVSSALKHLEDACSTGKNVMEPMIDSFRAGATIGEVNDVLRTVFGLWTSPSGV